MTRVRKHKASEFDGTEVLYDWGKATKGTNVYDEVDAEGHPLPYDTRVTGSIYVTMAVVPEDYDSVRVVMYDELPKVRSGEYVVAFEKKGDKKHVVRFDATSKNPAIRSLYVAKRINPPDSFYAKLVCGE